MRNGKRIYDSGFKFWIVEQAGKPGVSVATLAMRYGVNANQLRRWMGLPHWHSSGAADPDAVAVLPVTIVPDADDVRSAVSDVPSAAVAVLPTPLSSVAASGVPTPAAPPTIEITVGEVSVRVSGAVDLRALRTVIEALRA